MAKIAPLKSTAVGWVLALSWPVEAATLMFALTISWFLVP